MNYQIHLQDAPKELPEQAREQAERRFQRCLERALSGSEHVVQAYKAWQQAEESAEHELRPEEIALAKRWITAAQKAYQEGLRELGECEAYFEVRLVS